MTPVQITGIAYDGKSSFMQGPRFAPARILETFRSSAYNAYSEDLTEVLSTDLTVISGLIKTQDYHAITTEITKRVQSGSAHIFLGGDHSISFNIVKALSTVHAPFHILHFDAHGDLYDELYGDAYSHGCPFARIMEQELAQSLTQVGIRALTPQQVEQAEKFQVRVYEMSQLSNFDPASLSGPLYISLDMDALDPCYAPGVSHREFGGLSVRQVVDILRGINCPVIGADIVEYNPLQDIGDYTAIAASKLLRELIALMHRQPAVPSD